MAKQAPFKTPAYLSPSGKRGGLPMTLCAADGELVCTLDGANRAEAEFILQQVNTRVREQAPEVMIEQARATFGTDEIEVDSDAALSVGEDGAWVQGWLFIGK